MIATKPASGATLKLRLGTPGVALAVLLSNAVPAAEPQFPSGQPRLDRNNLLTYRDADGGIRPVNTVADWEKRRAEILAGAQHVMGPLPDDRKRCALDVKVEEETDCGAYVRRLISYASEPDSRVPAYLLVPKSALTDGKPCPAVLCLHPTDQTIRVTSLHLTNGECSKASDHPARRSRQDGARARTNVPAR